MSKCGTVHDGECNIWCGEPRTEAIFAEHRQCGTPEGYDGCYAHWPFEHCRADGMPWPCDVDALREAAAAPLVVPDGPDNEKFVDGAAPPEPPLDVDAVHRAICTSSWRTPDWHDPEFPGDWPCENILILLQREVVASPTRTCSDCGGILEPGDIHGHARGESGSPTPEDE